MSDAQKPNWLIMLYMVAGDDNKLDSDAVQDILEVERAVGRNSHVEAFVQVDRRWPANPQRYHIHQEGQKSVTTFVDEVPPPAGKKFVSMGDGETLKGFLEAALNTVPDAGHYCLVLWGHSFGLGFGRDHGDKMTLDELRGALEFFKDTRKRKLDLLGGNTCTMAYAEAIYQLKDSASYMVASEVFVPFAGWPYEAILEEIDGGDKPADLGRLIIDRYVEFYSQPDRDERVAMTLVQLEKEPKSNEMEPVNELNEQVKTLNETVRALAGGIMAVIRSRPADREALAQLQDAFLANSAGNIRPVLDFEGLARDLKDVCDDLERDERRRKKPGDRRLKALETLREATIEPRRFGGNLRAYYNAHPELEDLTGVGVFAPFVVDDGRLARLERGAPVQDPTDPETIRIKRAFEEYRHLQIFDDEKTYDWPDVVFKKLRPERPDEIVDINGLVRPAERSAVSHMVFAVDAAFRKLNRAIRAARELLLAELPNKRLGKLPTTRILVRLGPPTLRLAGMGTLLSDPKKLRAGKPGPPAVAEEAIINALVQLEDRLAQVERTTRRVVTDGKFGIGPSAAQTSMAPALTDKGLDPGQASKALDPGMTNKGLDPGFTDKGLDPGFASKGLDPGFGLPSIDGGASDADLGSKVVFVSTDQQLASLAMVDLYQHVARSLKRIERTIATVEQVVESFLSAPHFGEFLSDEDYKQAVQQLIDERFGVLTELSLQAHRTVRWVLRHPTFGLGLGPDSLGRGDRESLATAAGLSKQVLRLLTPTVPRQEGGR